MNILVTGAAGFIGYHLSKKLVHEGHHVVGLDNLNDYYDVNLKQERLKQLGVNIAKEHTDLSPLKSVYHPNFEFYKCSLENKDQIETIFKSYDFDIVCNLAAQAGVRYSIDYPEKYISSNVVGFLTILEACRTHHIEHLIYASSSSVYGNSKNTPFKTSQRTDSPVSLYAATKKSNELMAHTYSHLFNFKATGLRFFTVYGPWGRPDMAYYKFTKSILNDTEIPVYNNGHLARDFTYIDDIIEGMHKIINKGFISNTDAKNHAVYNLGKGDSVQLIDFIQILETELKHKAKFKMLPMQDGDVYKTWTDISELKKHYNYQPVTNIQEGLQKFVLWYKKYNQ